MKKSKKEIVIGYSDFIFLMDEIKNYTMEHPGNISSKDCPEKLMLGFVHDDGNEWYISITTAKRSLETSIDKRADIFKRCLITHEGKEKLNKTLSNPPIEVRVKKND